MMLTVLSQCQNITQLDQEIDNIVRVANDNLNTLNNFLWPTRPQWISWPVLAADDRVVSYGFGSLVEGGYLWSIPREEPLAELISFVKPGSGSTNSPGGLTPSGSNRFGWLIHGTYGTGLSHILYGLYVRLTCTSKDIYVLYFHHVDKWLVQTKSVYDRHVYLLGKLLAVFHVDEKINDHIRGLLHSMFLFHQDRVSSANSLKHFNKTFEDSYVLLYNLIHRFLDDNRGRLVLVLVLDNVRNAMCQNIPCYLNEILKFCYYQKYTVLIGFSGGDRFRCVPKMENNFNDCYIDISFTPLQASVFLQRQLLLYTSREYDTLKIVDDFFDLTGLYPCELTHLVTVFRALYYSVGSRRLNWADLAIQARIKKDYEMWSHRVLKSNFKSLTTRKPQVLRLQIKLAKASRSGRSYPIPNPTYVYRVFYRLEKTAEAENGTNLYNVKFIHNSVHSYHRGQNCHISPGIIHSFTSLSLDDDDNISITE